MNPIFLLVISTLVCSLQPGAKMNIQEFVFTQLTNYIIPIINQKLNNIPISNYTKKIPFFEVNFTNAHYTLDPIKNEQVVISYKNQSTKFDLKVYAMEGQVYFDIDYNLSKIKDHIHCDAYLKYMYIESTITNEISKAGTPAVKVSANLHMEPLKAELVFTGGTTAKLLEILEPIIRIFLVEATDLSINFNLHKWIADEINNILSTFVVDFKLTDQLFVTYELTSVSTYWNDSLEIPLSGYVYTVGKKYPPSNTPYAIPHYNETMTGKVEFVISDYLVNSALKQSFDNNILNVLFSYNLIFPFAMNLSCNASSVPSITFAYPHPHANLSFFCNASAYNKTDDTTTLFEVYGNFSFTLFYILYPASVRFFIFEIKINNLGYQKPEHFNITWFVQGAQDIAQYIVDIINNSYLVYGIPFPAMNHTHRKDLRAKMFNHNLGIYTNITFV